MSDLKGKTIRQLIEEGQISASNTERLDKLEEGLARLERDFETLRGDSCRIINRFLGLY